MGDIFDMYQAFAHTLVNLYEIWYVCVHCTLGEVLMLFTLYCSERCNLTEVVQH